MKVNTTKHIISDNLNINNGGAIKRVVALFIDFILMIVIASLFNFGVRPILNVVADYDTKQAAYVIDSKRNHLSLLSAPLAADESNIDNVTFVTDLSGRSVLAPADYAEGTYKFYTLFLNQYAENEEDIGTYTDVWYKENVLKIYDVDSLFTMDAPQPGEKKYASVADETSILTSEETEEDTSLSGETFYLTLGIYYKETTTIEQSETFNMAIYSEAGQLFAKRPLSIEVEMLKLVNDILLLILSTSVIFLAIPLFMKDGQTLGKRLFRLGVTTKHGYKVSVLTLLLRYIVFISLTFLPFHLLPELLFIFPFISLTFMVFNKKGRSAHDLIAGTMVVDLTRSTIYLDEDEYKHAQKDLSNSNRDSLNEEVFSERFNEESGA